MVMLYHASPFPLPGDVLNPATRNVAVEGNTARQVAYDDSATPYLYAADSRAESVTYAVPKGVRLGNVRGVMGRVEILFLDQENKIGDPVLQGGVYIFESENFMPMIGGDGPNGQWVSAQPLDLQGADYMPVRSFNDIMREGVQIYQVADSYDTDEFYNNELGAKGDFHEAIDRAAQAGKLRWMNQERNINPVYDLKPAALTPDVKRTTGPSPSP